MRLGYLSSVLLIGFVLSACAPTAASQIANSTTLTTPMALFTPTVKATQKATVIPTSQDAQTTAVQPTPTVQPAKSPAPEDASRTDKQGAVVVNVTPLNLGNPGETLDFEISMNTHSVELSMDLAELATLTTDNGGKVSASKWVAPSGGHHVEGKLLFPASRDGMPVLKGATKLTLTLRNVDAPERSFTWVLR